MPEGTGAVASQAVVGPNAILQLRVPVEDVLGPAVLAQVLDLCRVPMPTGQRMIPQEDVARVHRMLWTLFPDQAPDIARRAGQGTAGYIRSQRIPIAVRVALRLMPLAWAEPVLARAVENHAWTFCGSGRFETICDEGDIHFVVHNNPLADRDADPRHGCEWHSAVFADLFTGLLGARYFCREVSCCGMGAKTCHFVVSRRQPQGHFKGLRL